MKEKDISNYRFDEDYQYFKYKNINNLCINLKGEVQIKNASICIEAINIINKCGYEVNENSIREGLKTIIHRGRMEQLNDRPRIIYDGAHNEPAIKNLLDMVKNYYSSSKRVYIISILGRKDYKKMLEQLSKDEDASFILTSGNYADRYATSDELYECMKEYVKEDRIYKENLEDAIKNAMKEKEDTVNFVIGSFYVYGTVINKIKEYKENKI